MPAAPITAALLLHSQVPIDSDVGLKFGMEDHGLLVNSIGIKPTREETKHMDHRKNVVVRLYTTPELTLAVDSKVLLIEGALSALHPGEGIHPDYIQDFYVNVAHKFDTTTGGYFIHNNPDWGSPQGDLFTTKFDLVWFAPPTNTAALQSAPSAPA